MNKTSNFKTTQSLPKLMSREHKAEAEPKASGEGLQHIFQVDRFSGEQNVKITSIIKRMMPIDPDQVTILAQKTNQSPR